MNQKKSIKELVVQLKKSGINASISKSRKTINNAKLYGTCYSDSKFTVQS